MTTTNKQQFIEMLTKQAQEKMKDSDRRRRLDGRLELETLEIVKDVLPNKVKYNITSKGLIKSDYFNLNVNFKNVHMFINNTIGITNYDTLPYRNIVIIKATFKGVLRVKTADIYGKRLTLTDLLLMLETGKAKKYNRLSEVIGL